MDEVNQEPFVSFVAVEPTPLASFVARLREQANDANNPSGILHWSPFFPYALGEHDGVERRAVCDQPLWSQFHLELFTGRRAGAEIPSPRELQEIAVRYSLRGEVPIAIDHFHYETAKRTFVGNVLATVRKGAGLEMPKSADRVVESRRAFVATALLPNRSDNFTPLPHEHYGLDVKYVFPRELYLTNAGGEPSRIEADFDDGAGWRTVRFDEAIAVSYEAALPIHVRVRVEHGGVELSSTFRFTVIQPSIDVANVEELNLTATESFRNRPLANGWAWIVYARGRREVRRPIIFADGFGENRSTFQDIWVNRLNGGEVMFGDDLSAAGWDVILCGYGNRNTFIQENASVAKACIAKVLEIHRGTAPLVIVGGSMGGLVMRLALNDLERIGDHKTKLFISFDTPHNDAWLPLILQYMAHYYRSYRDRARELSDLVNSPAAQQMLWGHVPSWDFSGNPTLNREKQWFRQQVVGFPKKLRKVGIANGVATGQDNGVEAGAKNLVFHWLCYGGEALAQPHSGNRMHMGMFWVEGWPEQPYVASNIPPFDMVPGGTATYFAEAGKAVGAVPRFGRTCFVPTVSALAMKHPYNGLFQNINNVPPGNSELDDITTANRVTGHVVITRDIANWIMAEISKVS